MPSTPYMKLYINDYLGDTQHLSCLEHGAYMLLIMAYWQNGGPIKNDKKLLQRLTRTDARTFQKIAPVLAEMFDTVVLDDDKNDKKTTKKRHNNDLPSATYLVHRRIEIELAKRKQVSEAARDNISNRWNGRNTDVLPTNYARNTTPIVHSPDIDISKDISCVKGGKRETKTGTYSGQFTLFYEAYPKHENKGQASKSYNSAVKKGYSHEIIMERLSVYKSRIESLGTEYQYIRMASTFLNNLEDYAEQKPKPKPELKIVEVTPEMRAIIDKSYAEGREQ